MKTEPNATGAANAVPFEPFINKAEVSRRLVVSARTVEAWMLHDGLPHYKPGHAVRFRWSEVQSWLAQTSHVCRLPAGKSTATGRREKRTSRTVNFRRNQ